jgi:hypothetical protein
MSRPLAQHGVEYSTLRLQHDKTAETLYEFRLTELLQNNFDTSEKFPASSFSFKKLKGIAEGLDLVPKQLKYGRIALMNAITLEVSADTWISRCCSLPDGVVVIQIIGRESDLIFALSLFIMVHTMLMVD